MIIKKEEIFNKTGLSLVWAMVNLKVPRRGAYWMVIIMVENQTFGSSHRIVTLKGNKPSHHITLSA
uniref:Uncharacterized protein n=1 Tax=Rhizophagus irregularis (strain DAOM 181602 / DAOM 197198 / MUCL 43194) TaxID=747089 RepID=U9UUV3_RHIID